MRKRSLALQKACAAEAYPIEFHLRRGDSLVTRCRNDCVAVFLANPRFTHLFIDADIGFAPEAAFRLLLADRDVVAGVYPLSAAPGRRAACRRARRGRASRRSTSATR